MPQRQILALISRRVRLDLFLLDLGFCFPQGPSGLDSPDLDNHAGSHFQFGSGLTASAFLIQQFDQREFGIIRWFPRYFFEDFQPEV